MRSLESFLRAAAARFASSDTPHLDARVLAKHALGLDDAGLILAGDRPLTEVERAAMDKLIERRQRGEPVSQIVGEKEFFGLTFEIAPGVLTPRPDSETLIEAALRRRDPSAPLRALDLGTGSGCLLCALLKEFPRATGIGVDVSAEAVALARRNADRLGLCARAGFVEGDWEAAPSGPFDIIVSNPPYIPDANRGKLAREVRDFEDPKALFGGPDGLDGYRRVLAAAQGRIAPDGLIILELGAGQDEQVCGLARALFPGAGIEFDADLAGRPRAIVIELRLEPGPQKSV